MFEKSTVMGELKVGVTLHMLAHILTVWKKPNLGSEWADLMIYIIQTCFPFGFSSGRNLRSRNYEEFIVLSKLVVWTAESQIFYMIKSVL